MSTGNALNVFQSDSSREARHAKTELAREGFVHDLKDAAKIEAEMMRKGRSGRIEDHSLWWESVWDVSYLT